MIIRDCILGVSNRKRVIVWVTGSDRFSMMNECYILTRMLHNDTHIQIVGGIVICDSEYSIIYDK